MLIVAALAPLLVSFACTVKVVLSSESIVAFGVSVMVNIAALAPVTVTATPVSEKPPLLRTVKVVSTGTLKPRVPRSMVSPPVKAVFTGCSTTMLAAASENGASTMFQPMEPLPRPQTVRARPRSVPLAGSMGVPLSDHPPAMRVPVPRAVQVVPPSVERSKATSMASGKVLPRCHPTLVEPAGASVCMAGSLTRRERLNSEAPSTNWKLPPIMTLPFSVSMRLFTVAGTVIGPAMGSL